jgi:hypothetical protein
VFDSKRKPSGTRLNTVYGSHLGHYDLTDMRDTQVEAYEDVRTRVDDPGCEIPAKCASFAQVRRECRKLKTRWRSEVNSKCRATTLWTVSKPCKSVKEF